MATNVRAALPTAVHAQIFMEFVMLVPLPSQFRTALILVVVRLALFTIRPQIHA